MTSRAKERLRTYARLVIHLLRVMLTAWQWFGPSVCVRFILGLPHLLTSSRKSLAVVYEQLGNLKFRRRFCGTEVRWSYADIDFVREVFQEECYTKHAHMEIGRHDTVVDAGANVGTFTVLAALKAPAGRVIALEPQSRSFARLLRNIEANSLQNVTSLNAALASYDGSAILREAECGSGSNSLIRGDSARGELVQVLSPFTLMSRYNLHHVDLLKLDIEGAEYGLFSGDLSWLERIDRIALEAHRQMGEPQLLIARLEGAGFHVEVEPVKRPFDQDLQIYAIRAELGDMRYWDSPTADRHQAQRGKARKAGLRLVQVAHCDAQPTEGDRKTASWRQGFGPVNSSLRERFHG